MNRSSIRRVLCTGVVCCSIAAGLALWHVGDVWRSPQAGPPLIADGPSHNTRATADVESTLTRKDTEETDPAGTSDPNTAAAPIVALILTDPGAAVLQRLEATILTLQASLNIRLVDRSRLERVLREHELAAAGMMDRDAALHMGRLLAADFLLITDPYGDDGFRLRAVDRHTGMILADDVHPAGEDASEERIVDALRTVIQPIIAGHSLPQEQRVYVAVPGITSEVDDELARQAAAALEPLISNRLRRQAGVFVLERQELHRLAQETAIAGEAPGFAGSARLVEGSVRRTGDGGIHLQLLVTSLLDGTAETTNLASKSDQLRHLRDQAVDVALGRELDHAAAAVRAADVTEAERLMTRAQWLACRLLRDEAQRMVEASLALDDNPDQLAEAYRVYRFGIRPAIQGRHHSDDDESLTKIYRMLLRQHELYEAAQRHTAAIHLPPRQLLRDWAHERATTAQQRQILNRVIAVEWDLYHRRVERAQTEGKPTWEIHLDQLRMLRGLATDGEVFRRDADRVIDALIPALEGVESPVPIDRTYRLQWTWLLAPGGRFASESMAVWLRSLMDHPHVMPRFIGTSALMHVVSGSDLVTETDRVAAAMRTLDMAFYEDDALLVPGNGVQQGVRRALNILRRQSDELFPWFDKLVEHVSEGDALALTRLSAHVREVIDVVGLGEARIQRRADRYRAAVARRIAAAVAAAPLYDEALQGTAQRVRRVAEGIAEPIEQRLATAERLHDERLWDEIELVPLTFDGAADEMRRVMFYYFDGDPQADRYGGPLVIAWEIARQADDRGRTARQTLRFTRSSAMGGKLQVIGDARVVRRATLGVRERQASFVEGTLYLPTGDALAVVGDGATRYRGAEHGAPPGSVVNAVHVGDRRLLVAIDHSLAWFDLDRETFQTIVSDAEVADENPLRQMLGGRYIRAMHHVPGLRRVYLAGSGRTTIRFDLDSESFTEIEAPADRQIPLQHNYLRHFRGDLIMLGTRHTWRLNTADDEFERYEPEWWRQRNFQTDRGPLLPGRGIWIGNDYCLFQVQGRGLGIYSADQRRAHHRRVTKPDDTTEYHRMSGFSFHQPLAHGVLVGRSSIGVVTRREPVLFLVRPRQ